MNLEDTVGGYNSLCHTALRIYYGIFNWLVIFNELAPLFKNAF